jgi:hypothetical protein|tara:strand:+ start:693 stop:2759 length:2067 start_codon:yes stop_codon:yes gene_type:complete
MAKSSRYFRIDEDVLLEFIYHDQSNPDATKIEVDDNGSEVKFLDTVKNVTTAPRHLINELGSDVVNFDVTTNSGYLSIENFAARTLLLQNGKTYKFDLSALDNPGDFTISGSLGIYSYSGTTMIGQYIPNQNGTVEYNYPNLIGGKIIVDTRANPLFSTPDEVTGNDINQPIGRYHGIKVPNDESRYALLGYDSTGYYEMFNYINNASSWTGGNEADLINYQVEATQNINYIQYDSVRLHLKSGYSFSARNYEGFLFEVTTERTTGIKNYLTQLVYLNTSNYEYANPRPFILGETLWSKFIEIKIPSIIGQNSEFRDRFYGDGTIGSSDLDITSNYGVSFKLIDKLEVGNGFDYFYVGEENKFTVSREDEYQDFTVVIEDANDGDYFKIYGEKDNSIGAFEAYVLNRIQTSSDDIIAIFDVDVFEQIGSTYVKTNEITFTQYEDFNDPILFRPIIKNANVAVNFSIEVTMRIYNQTDNTQIVKRASMILNQAGKYGKKLSALKINSPNIMTEVYNILPNLSGNKVIKSLLMDSVPRSVKVVPAFIERHNIIATSSKVKLEGEGNNLMIKDVEEIETSAFMEEGNIKISIPPFACYFKFVISKKIGDDIQFISFENAERLVLSFGDGTNKLVFNHISNKDIDMGEGEVLFKINEANAKSIRNMTNSKFYISVDNGTEQTYVTSGQFIKA